MGEQKKELPSLRGRQLRNESETRVVEMTKAIKSALEPTSGTLAERIKEMIPDTGSAEEDTMQKPPEAFISYSYDSDDHVNWVEKLAKRLREHGVDVMLDKWLFKLGKPSGTEMNEAIAEADRVLCICTDTYVSRVDTGERGAGYEGFLINTELVKNAVTEKFIPIIRNIKGGKKAPTCLDGRLRVDLSDGAAYDAEYEKLLRDLHNAVEIPPIGKKPF
jgi:hypothetical protein